MSVVEQLSFDVHQDVCEYGLPGLGEQRHCDLPVTHVACWHQPAGKQYYGEVLPEMSGSVRCCRGHADYYASAWAPHYPGESVSAWIEIVP